MIAYFAVIRPLTAVEDDGTVTQELLPGEVQVTAKTTNIYIFDPLERSEIQSARILPSQRLRKSRMVTPLSVWKRAACISSAGVEGVTWDPVPRQMA